MKILIFEGIATSGKSTVISRLEKIFKPNVCVYDEATTHIPIMKDTDSYRMEFFKKLVVNALTQNVDLIIFDRLYLTQAFRAKATLKDYAEIEELLSTYSVTTIFLKVDENKIEHRVSRAVEHREIRWADYIKTKGETAEDIAEYYTKQQRSQLSLLKQSTLPYKIFNTSNHDYENIGKKVADFIKA